MENASEIKSENNLLCKDVTKRKAIEFLIKYHESDYCYEEDGMFFLEIDKPKITISELYDILMK